MKIEQIRFKNLNSLVGEWQIDLTHADFACDGIFAITGPTGAGKTTILDAICLALYGRTPRLSRVTAGDNQIMSRQTGECFAEVTFATPAGRFRCHWSQHRARRSPDGDLQAAKHEIADAVSGALLETRRSEVAHQIETCTGMNFERFTRSMLLAQGDFAVFLQAAADERAPILEQITGTEIYSQISICVHERQREERAKLDLLQAETAGILILNPKQEKEISQILEEKQQEEASLSITSVETGQAIAWLTTINGLQQEIFELTREAGRLQTDIEGFQPDHEKLTRALGAAALEGDYATLAATRKQHREDRVALTAGEDALPGLEFSAMKQAEELKAVEQQSAQSKKALQAAAPTLRKVRFLDQQLADQKKSLDEGELSCQKDATKIEADIQARMKEQKKWSVAQKNLELVDGYLREQAQDEWLISGLAGVEEQCGGLLATQKEIQHKETDQAKAESLLKKTKEALDSGQRQWRIRQQELDDATRRLQYGKDVLGQLLEGRLLREYRTQKETLLREMAFMAKIAELEDHRAKLEDDQPCPLCGATEHPFARGNVPVADATEQQIAALARLISAAEDQEAVIKKCEETENLARKNLSEAEKQQIAAANDKQTAEKTLAEVTATLARLRADSRERRQAVAKRLLPLGISELPAADVAPLLASLGARQNAWLTQVKKKAETEKQLADHDSNIKRLDAVIETQRGSLAEKRERLASLKEQFTAARDERQALYGAKRPDDEELRLHQAIVAAESAEKQARDLHHEMQQQWHTAKAHIETLRKGIDQREPELTRLEEAFSSALAAAGFTHEEDFLAARLTSGQRAELTTRARELDERQTDLKARHKDRQSRLELEMSRKVTDQSLSELEPRFKAYDDALKALRDIVAGLKHQLTENAAAKERIKEKQAVIDAQKAECRRWENLHALIGSADGKKFRNFAQGLTFEVMIAHANQQLQKMSDRYLLLRAAGQPLELNVIDNYQAGEIRSTKNLSGGESFIVSLALALGLSQMASKKVRVDSLFLDEGFGTLDEAALDTALETLAGLQQSGKLIGIISHVPQLKERVATRIQVLPRTGGRSEISGPGCARL